MNRRSFVVRSLGLFAGLTGLSTLPKSKALSVKSSVIDVSPDFPHKIVASGKVLKCDGTLHLSPGSRIYDCRIFCDHIQYGDDNGCGCIKVINNEFFVSRVSHPHPLGGTHLTFWKEPQWIAEGSEFSFNRINFDSGTVLSAKRKFLV